MSHADRVAYILGDFRDVLRDMFLQDVIAPYRLLPSPVTDPDEVLAELTQNPTIGSDLTLILLCSEEGDSLVSFIQRILELRPKKGRVVVLSQDADCDGSLAIQWLRAGARDFLDIGYPPGYLLDHVLGAISGNLPYMEQISLPLVTAPKDLFVITPFEHPSAIRDFHHGIVPACLSAFELNPIRGDGRHAPSSVLESVTSMLDNAKIVIVNLSAYGGPPNANVYFEVGYTHGKWPDKLIPLMRRNEPVPSNFSGMKLVQYSGCADLAIHLFHLLKGRS